MPEPAEGTGETAPEISVDPAWADEEEETYDMAAPAAMAPMAEEDAEFPEIEEAPEEAEAEAVEEAEMEKSADEAEADAAPAGERKDADYEKEASGAISWEAAETEEAAVNSVNLGGRELLEDSTVQALSARLASGRDVNSSRVSVPAVINSLDYEKLMPAAFSSIYCELILTDSRIGRLFIVIAPDIDTPVSVLLDTSGNDIAGIRLYGDEEYTVPSSDMTEIITEDMAGGETRALLLDVEFSSPVRPGSTSVRLIYDIGSVQDSRTVKASSDGMSDAFWLAYNAGQAAVLLKNGTEKGDEAYQRILFDLGQLEETEGTADLLKMVRYLTKD